MFFRKVIICTISILLLCSISKAQERSVRVLVDVDLKAPSDADKVRLWLPYPMSDRNQDVTNVKIEGNYASSSVLREAMSGNTILFAEWQGAAQSRRISFSFDVARKESVTRDFPGKELPLPRYELREYMATPANEKVKAISASITKNKKATLAKARAVYDWIVDNMNRDPDVKGCGLGIVDKLLETRGGKCADIHSVFVAIARAADVPAREILGIRIPKGKNGDMTKAQHCWAEFYLPGYGWVVVDPADVAKARLEQKLDKEQLKPLREYYFGAVDESRIAYGIGRGTVLNPPQNGEPLSYFMYPYAETDGKILNEDLYGFNIGYRISFKDNN